MASLITTNWFMTGALDSGSSVVTVKVPTEHVERVTAILEQHHPVDMDERAASYGTSATTTTTTTTGATPAVGITSAKGTGVAAGGEEVIALSEEQLQVGKRLVNHGPPAFVALSSRHRSKKQ